MPVSKLAAGLHQGEKLPNRFYQIDLTKPPMNGSGRLSPPSSILSLGMITEIHYCAICKVFMESRDESDI
jgi:hypothetical protein